MAFKQVSASMGERSESLLSADNHRPERHIVIDTLRQAAPLIGLKAPVIATLDVMLSCLPPTRQHNTVFASNATLAFRRNGISDRTIRRHAAILQELGLLERRDSANRKRFCRQNLAEGTALRFGFDLTPLFERFAELSKLAAQAAHENNQKSYLKAKIRAAANAILDAEPSNVDATAAIRSLRRSLSLEDCLNLLNSLDFEAIEAEQPCDKSSVQKEKMSGNDGQNVRHHHNSQKEHTDIESEQKSTAHPKDPKPFQISVLEILSACPEAAQFCVEPVKTMKDVVTHARTLAPMLGIDSRNYQDAQENLGIERAALTVWAIMQFHEKIRKVGAYFRSITSGKKSEGFHPEDLIRRLSRAEPQPA
ncbi:replication initiation protein RepC [Roseinatronobacter monicus]|uniref:Replication initiation protein RepC n=2 Tax=Roseinatronobacter monicus TaxID=393481 RepID=A0A543K461_9RHOB|nr:replication protein C [Paracoccaceae bacterium]TQM89868.1 replication initiation protein RepC [Roseinatronobacter monicus]